MSGEMKAKSDRLRAVADIWSDCATDCWSVHTSLQPALGQGSKFGILAGASGVDENYDIWIEKMSVAARTGSGNFFYLKSALDAIADTYDGVDSTVAQSMDSLDKQVGA